MPTRAHPPQHDRHDGEAVGDGLGRGEDDGVQVERAGPGVDPRPVVRGVVVIVIVWVSLWSPETTDQKVIHICRTDRTDRTTHQMLQAHWYSPPVPGLARLR